MDARETSERPQTVRAAVNMLWASIGFGLAKALLDFSHLFAPATLKTFIATAVLTVVIMAWLILKTSSGANWARLTLLVLFAVGALLTPATLAREFSRSSLVGALTVVQFGLQFCALALLFVKPSRGWFSKVNHIR
ncbi:hypothetical protein K6V72_08940 [Ralstonia insidiosa]|jgi:hypothetical protein|uniref:Uncharacterized protein n=1 Tax=Ralstonia insidiosa TaxID=190721 RepID=A0A192A1G7_9RALS|nr:hypothetical protein [Ralstonia insidiosa]ANJ74142.1 hypothetical protein A9Y76_17540 [Ralstonia insidiosa]KAB0471359.1 hypothetical protein F7R11_01790 [Ralstonia insidiosa]MBY4909114.1 hypothetical protein [Ralstonia insidiosa]